MTNTLLTLLSQDRLDAEYRSGAWRDETIYALFKAHAERVPDRVAIRDRYRTLTWGALRAAVDALAADFAHRGLRPGQRVLVWLPSRIETVTAVLACWRNGYMCCPSLHRDHTVSDILGLLERTRAAVLVAEEGYGADADRRDIFMQAAGLASLRHLYRVPPLTPETPQRPFAGLTEAAGEAAGKVDGAANADPNRIVYLAFTSGTTGLPKGVMHSDNTLLATVRTAAVDWHLDETTVLYSLSPLSHNLGVSAIVTLAVTGGTLVVQDLPRGRSLLDRLVETGATYLIGVPTHAIDLLAELKARGGATQLGAVKGFRISGAAVPSEVAAELLARGVVPQSGYGMTETCSHQYTLPDDPPRLITESSGRCCAGYEIRIFAQDDPERALPPGEVGQIAGRGASLMLGYFNDQASTEDSFNAQGWFMTGDLGWVDEQGYLRITGRKKDVIIRGGHNIYPARIEALALRHAAVARAAAVPVADARLGEKVCLAVTLRGNATLDTEDMLAHLDAAGLSKYDMPEYFLVLDEIPLTSSGKLLKRELVAWLQQGRVTPQPIRFQAKTEKGER